MLAFGEKSALKGNESAKRFLEKVERRNTFSALKATTLEERKSSFLRTFSSLSELNNVRISTITGHYEPRKGYNAVAKRSTTFSSRHPGITTCVSSTNKPNGRLPYDDRALSRQISDTSLLMHHSMKVSENNGKSRVTASGHAPESSQSEGKNQSGHARKRSSSLSGTRVELELAINKDDRRKLLLAIQCKTVNLDEKDYFGKTLLHTACSVGNYRCAQILIDAGSGVDIKDHSGFTALHCAVVSNHVPCAAVLISSGADVMAKTKTMHTVLTLAHEDEMILLIGRSLLLRDTSLSSVGKRKEHRQFLSLKETNL